MIPRRRAQPDAPMRIPAADWNALMDLLEAPQSISGLQGLLSSCGLIGAVPGRYVPAVVQCYATAAIPAYGVFGVRTGETADDLATTRVEQIGESQAGSMFALYTNGKDAIAAGSYFPAELIDARTCRLLLTGTAPAAGEPCGVVPGTWGIGATYAGLVCRATPTGDGYAWASMASSQALLGVVDTTITAYAPGTSTLGSGTVAVNARQSLDDTLISVSSPAAPTEAQTLTVYNYTPVPIPTGSVVAAVAVAGIGFVCLPLGVEPESSSGSGSGPVGGTDCGDVILGGPINSGSLSLGYGPILDADGDPTQLPPAEGCTQALYRVYVQNGQLCADLIGTQTVCCGCDSDTGVGSTGSLGADANCECDGGTISAVKVSLPTFEKVAGSAHAFQTIPGGTYSLAPLTQPGWLNPASGECHFAYSGSSIYIEVAGSRLFVRLQGLTVGWSPTGDPLLGGTGLFPSGYTEYLDFAVSGTLCPSNTSMTADRVVNSSAAAFARSGVTLSTYAHAAALDGVFTLQYEVG